MVYFITCAYSDLNLVIENMRGLKKTTEHVNYRVRCAKSHIEYQ